MWKFTPFFLFLYELLNHPTVGEVIVLNNNANDTPHLTEHPKLRMMNFVDNTMINPAWNYGVANANFDYLCILNDDVLFDLNQLPVVIDFLEKGKLITINLQPPEKPFDVIGEGRIVKYHLGYKLYHIGCMMFVHRDDWEPIPAGLNLYYGDNWLWDVMLARYNENYLLENIFIETPTNVTCGSLPNMDRHYEYLKETELVSGSLAYFVTRAASIKR